MCCFCIDCQHKSPSPATVHRSAPVWLSMRFFADVCTNKNSILYAHTHSQSHTHAPTHNVHAASWKNIYFFIIQYHFSPFLHLFSFSLCLICSHFFYTMCNVLQATLVANIEYVRHVAQLQMGNVKKWLIDGCLERKLFLLSLCYITEISKNPSGLFFKFFCFHLNYIQVSYEQSLKLTRTTKLL